MLLPLFLTAQRYNQQDTTWTLNYKELIIIEKKVQGCIDTKQTLQIEMNILEKEVVNLENQSDVKDVIIKKLELKDSLGQIQLEKSNQIEALLREKIIISNDIMSNYKLLLFSTEDQLRIEAKKAKREKLWKNIYKIGIPAAGLAALFLIN